VENGLLKGPSVMLTLKHRKQRGFIAAYILYGISLIAIVGAAYGKLYASNERERQVQLAVDEVLAQVEVIRSKILLCGAIYPNGDHGQFAARFAYPAPSTSGNRDVLTAVVCPGAPSGSQYLNNLSDGTAIPIPPADFSPWEYEHTLADGIRIHLVAKRTGGGAVIFSRLIRQLGNSSVLTGDDLAITILN
jgi:hypothetical protein